VRETANVTELLARHRQVMGHDAPLFYNEPVELVKGDGVWLEAADGTRYLDLYNNVPCVGHANARVADAVATQAATLNVHSRYLHANVVEYLERLVDLHASPIESVILACSGTEATEMAIRMAQGATGQQGIICTNATYHGNSALVSRLTRLPVGTDRDGVRSISAPQTYRPLKAGCTDGELLQLHLDELAATIASLQQDGYGFAGIMLCSILANEGLPNPPAAWFEQALRLVREAGGLVIADEVQAGFARSGSWWGYEANSFEPDIVCMGKPMANGMPLSGVAASNDMISAFRAKHRYFNTFAASPLQAAAGMAVIQEITDRELVTSVGEVGTLLKNELAAMQRNDDRMGDVRGTGLFVGIDWVVPGTNEPDVEGAAGMVEALKERGMLLGKAGQHANVLKIRPPLVFDADNAATFLDAFADALQATQ